MLCTSGFANYVRNEASELESKTFYSSSPGGGTGGKVAVYADKDSIGEYSPK